MTSLVMSDTAFKSGPFKAWLTLRKTPLISFWQASFFYNTASAQRGREQFSSGVKGTNPPGPSWSPARSETGLNVVSFLPSERTHSPFLTLLRPKLPESGDRVLPEFFRIVRETTSTLCQTIKATREEVRMKGWRPQADLFPKNTYHTVGTRRTQSFHSP